ncbi:MAG: glycosyltransferase [Clostridia bacterium]|nr:glycosyltransferase [Clostridia bacterium]
MLKPDISIVMGIYNCADTLDEAIKSILDQTYTDWKMIMCDDASSDNTYQVAKKYVEKYPDKFILIKNEKNMGLNYTLNHCLQYADTKYVARMDGDDISLPERFEKEINFLKKNPEYAIVSAQMEYFDQAGIFGKSSGLGEAHKENIPKGTPFCHAPCMVLKEAFDAVGGYSVSKRLLRMEDYELWIKMYAQGYKGYNLPEVLYRMRDDRNATKRRKFRYRINEAYVRYLAVKRLGLSKKYLIYMARPILVGLLPAGIYTILHKKRLKGD